MAANQREEQEVSLKLLVNKETNKVLFAEAGKDFVDVLFSFLTLPLGTIARLLRKDSNIGPVTIGCLNSFYQSVVDLDNNYLLSEESKEVLLQPKNPSEDYYSSIKIIIDDTQPTDYFIGTKLATCSRPSFTITTSLNKVGHDRISMIKPVQTFYNGFVNDVATFVITDDLNVIPNASGYTNLALIQNSGIKSLSSMKEMTKVLNCGCGRGCGCVAGVANAVIAVAATRNAVVAA